VAKELADLKSESMVEEFNTVLLNVKFGLFIAFSIVYISTNTTQNTAAVCPERDPNV
jgi:hypothetical protein